MSTPTLRLKLVVDGKKKKFKTTKPSIFLGSAKLCDIRLKLKGEDACFIEIKILENQIYLVNKNTQNGLYVNGQEVPAKGETVYHTGQSIFIGENKVDLEMSLEGVEEEGLTVKKEKSQNVLPMSSKTRTRKTNTEGLEIYQLSPLTQALSHPRQTAVQMKTQSQTVTQPSMQVSEPLVNEKFEPSIAHQQIQELLQTQTDEQKNKLEEFSEEYKELKKEYLKLKKDFRLHEYHCAELETKENYLKEKVSELKEDFALEEEKKQILEQEVSTLSSQREVAGVEVESFRSEKEHLVQDIESLKIELKEHKDNLSGFTQKMMDEYAAKKEEAMTYYENKVKEATEYFDQKERAFKEEHKEVQNIINNRLKECDEQILREKEMWKEQLKSNQAEQELLKEKVYNEAYAEKDKIIKSAEEEALQTASETTELAEKEKNELLASVQKESEEILSKARREAEDTVAKAQREAEEAIDKANKESEDLLSKANRESEELLNKAQHENEEVLIKAERAKEEILHQAEEERGLILKKFKEEGEEAFSQLEEEGIKKKEDIIQKAQLEGERLHQEILEDAEKSKNKILDEALRKAEREANDIKEHAENMAKETIEKAEIEFEEIKKEGKILDDRINHSRNEFRKEEEESRHKFEEEIKERYAELEQDLVNKKLDQEKAFNKAKERNLAREKARIKSNIENVSENIKSLIEQRMGQAGLESDEVLAVLTSDELREIVSDSFDVDAPVHNKKLGQFLLKNANSKEMIKKFHKKIAILGGCLLVLIIAFIINPNWIGDTKKAFIKSISLEKSATDSLVESMKEAQLNRPKFNPKRSAELRESFVDSILYTDQYRELVVTTAFKKKWTVEMSLFVFRDLQESDEIVIKYVAIEAEMHNEIIEAFNTIYDEHKDKGMIRLREIEGKILPKMKALFKKDVHWEKFLKFRDKFFQQYKESV